jgi:hypothetical protein
MRDAAFQGAHFLDVGVHPHPLRPGPTTGARSPGRPVDEEVSDHAAQEPFRAFACAVRLRLAAAFCAAFCAVPDA